MLQDDYIKQCFINASKKKKNRNDVREVLENLDEHTELLKFKPIVMNGLYEFSCGSIPDRGVHYGKKYMR